MEREFSDNPDVHRELIVQDPPQRGRDIANFQRATYARLKAVGWADDVPVPTHGKFTHATWVAGVEAGYRLGLLSKTYLATDKRRGMSTEGAQQIIRNPDERTDDQLTRARERVDQLKRGPRYYDELAEGAGMSRGKGPKAALSFASSCIGVVERPSGSNWGPKISDWIRATGYNSPVPWCFAPGTLVNALDGLRPIETLGVGEIVMSAHGLPAVVNAVHVRKAERFKLVAHVLDGTVVSGEHPYIARRRLPNGPCNVRVFGDPEWIDVRDLSRGDLIAQPVLSGDAPMDSAKAYIIGRYLADGWGTVRAARGGRAERIDRFICDSHDKRDEIANALADAGLGWSERIYPTVVQFALRVDATPLLDRCGIAARSKHLPPGVLTWNVRAREALLQGYLDGDGCIYKGTTRANSISRELMLGIAQVARSLGHVVIMRSHSREPEAVIAGRTIQQATTRYEISFLNADSRNKTHLTGLDMHAWVPVRSVDEVEPGLVHNLTVSDEHTFIADGYAVHNCGCACNSFCMAGGVPSGAGWIGYTPAIVTRARRKIGGWSWHSTGEPGDLALFDTPGGDPAIHVGMVEKRVNATTYMTIEGNTSSGSSGSQSEGGGVYRRRRSTQGNFRIIGFARPPWPK